MNRLVFLFNKEKVCWFVFFLLCFVPLLLFSTTEISIGDLKFEPKILKVIFCKYKIHTSSFFCVGLYPNLSRSYVGRMNFFHYPNISFSCHFVREFSFSYFYSIFQSNNNSCSIIIFWPRWRPIRRQRKFSIQQLSRARWVGCWISSLKPESMKKLFC